MGLVWGRGVGLRRIPGENVHLKTHKHTAHIRLTHVPKKQHINNALKYAHMH